MNLRLPWSRRAQLYVAEDVLAFKVCTGATADTGESAGRTAT
jgi:hypothetical protein